MFEKANPGVKVVAVGTGPGDSGSQKIFEKLEAQKKAGTEKWDFDVVVIHQKMAGQMVGEGLLSAYKDQIQTGSLVTRDTAKNALGADVSGYVMPMFHSQTAIAYNPDLTKDVPNSYSELIAWVSKNPKKFGYNGIKGGMSGVAFVTGWVYAFGGDAGRLMAGPYDAASKAAWDKALADLKEFNKNVVITPGNAGTLDMLNRGEIAMGPVWVDMFYTWMADGKLPPGMKLKLVAPGMPGQPMYYAIPAKAANAELAQKFVALATSPEVQGEGIVKKFNWYPGIDAKHLEGKLDSVVWKKLFADISPEELSLKGMPFPLAQYFNEILEAYERKVAN
jgi:putative spermidine/putrescine transport system substrate-binding protein